jgi:hypothetical protein
MDKTKIKPIDYNWMAKLFADYDGDILKFSQIHETVSDEIGSTRYDEQGSNFSKWITRLAKRVAADIKGCEIYIKKGGKRATGIKFNFPPRYPSGKQNNEPKPPPPELDLLTVGKAIDRYITELKSDLAVEQERAILSNSEKNRIISDLRASCKDKDRIIEKLNRQIINLNNLIKSDSRKNKNAGFT